LARPDAVIVGSGPNGLTAAARLALSGQTVLVLEAAGSVGGGTRSSELTEPGFIHDICSAIHPFGVISPAYLALSVPIDWVTPPIAMAHPLDDGTAVALHNSVAATAGQFEGDDGKEWAALVGPLVADLENVVETFLAARILPNPFSKAARIMGVHGSRSSAALADRFGSVPARALIAGLAAHAIAPLDNAFTAGIALLFAAVGNGRGWPLVRGGSQNLAGALAAIIGGRGGQIELNREVADISEFAGSSVFLDVNPSAAREIARHRMNPADIVMLGRWKPGPGVFKVDYALDGPIPWTDSLSSRAGTVHLGGSFEEIADAEAAVAAGDHAQRPFVIVAQQSDFDPSRAPAGKRTGWAYCHVPNGSDVDMTSAIEGQIERFAPGFTERIISRHATTAAGMERYNPNYVGGDIGGGVFTPGRFLPSVKNPYRVGDGLYLCSSATPPGGGTHGMCGWNAAAASLS
jgi:phytoene dehydrogenase-like protein